MMEILFLIRKKNRNTILHHTGLYRYQVLYRTLYRVMTDTSTAQPKHYFIERFAKVCRIEPTLILRK